MTIMGSLGFNPNRRHRSSNLPGALNTVVVRTRLPGQRRMQATKEVSVLVPRRNSPKRSVETTPRVASVQAATVRPSPSPPPTQEEVHWVYATVVDRHLRTSDDPNEIVCKKDARVLLVYPMMANPDTGIVSMKVKTVDAGTGQLSMQWVDVYDPNTDTRLVSQFSMVP